MTPQTETFLTNLTEGTITLMGISFILGSLFTILILIILDVMRRHSGRDEESH